MGADSMRVVMTVAGPKAKLAEGIARLLAVPVAVVETAAFAEQRLKELTPRSDEGSPHAADLWQASADVTTQTTAAVPQGRTASGRYTAATAAKSSGWRMVVSNPLAEPGATHPRTGQPTNDGDWNLVAGMELGTRPHGPKHGKVMTFMGRDGHLVSIKWRPHHMIRQTRKEAGEFFRNRIREILGSMAR